MKQTLVIRVTGKVQGVYFRQNTMEKAVQLGVTGKVRNMRDGSVELTATGDLNQLQSLVQWCHEGPGRARVENVITTAIPLQEFEKFVIER